METQHGDIYSNVGILLEKIPQNPIILPAMSEHTKLNELKATAICGNDISSSCLYVSALSIIYAGSYAWIALLMVGAVLFLFRRIYGEVVGALPLNGGAYNALLNTTSKFIASMAACLTMLSYVATAVISGSEAMHYLHHLIPTLQVTVATILLLAFFMGLTIFGIGESAVVAVVIFIFHLFSLVLLSAFCGFYLFQHGFDIFRANNAIPPEGGITQALFFGFAAAMLGISGFESSANFVEEQEAGVFRKTLRNMWAVVTIFNPLMAFLALSILPAAQVPQYKNALLSQMGEIAGGSWLSFVVSIDAVLVLSGAVLTSFIGVSGLVERMALDRIMPQGLLRKNKRNTSYLIMISFFALCVSILFATGGELGPLAGVYTISFLSVMVLFGIGNILLKAKRNKLPRPERASIISVLVAVAAVSIALVGNITMNPEYFAVFLKYFIPTALLVIVMLNRSRLLLFSLRVLQYFYKPFRSFILLSHKFIGDMIERVNGQEFVFFTKGDDVAILYKVMLYVSQNENTNRLRIVNVYKDNIPDNDDLKRDMEVLDRAWPEIKINFMEIPGHFGPELIEQLSKEWNIPTNFMFIGSPGDRFPYRIAELGGVRLII